VSFDPEMPNGWYFGLYGVKGAATSHLSAPTITQSGGFQTEDTKGYQPFNESLSGVYYAPNGDTTGLTELVVNFAFYYDGSGTVAVPPKLVFGGSPTLPTTPSGDFLFTLLNPNMLGHSP